VESTVFVDRCRCSAPIVVSLCIDSVRRNDPTIVASTFVREFRSLVDSEIALKVRVVSP
jgi:hypothetical protein